MAETSLAKKLGIKPGRRVAIFNAPAGYRDRLGALPDGVEIETGGAGPFDVVQVFVYHRADVDARAPEALRVVRPDGFLWLTYPKKTGAIKTDITRDLGWDAVWTAGFEGVAIVSVDETWSALRFRPSSAVKSRNR